MRPAYVLYAVALLASYASLFGSQGLVAGVVVLCLWAFIFGSTNRPRALATILALAVIIGCLWAVLVPVEQAREASSRSTCKNYLKQIGIALHNYHERYGSFPPAYVPDENGKPMHSWRVLLLPFLDQQELYERYDFNKPWNSPENLEIAKHMPTFYACPSPGYETDKPETTSYVAIVGPGTAWPGAEPAVMNDLTDGLANIILLVESHSPEIPWTEPRDLSPEQAAEALASEDIEPFGGHRYESFFYEHFPGRNTLFGDGRVLFAPFGMDRTIALQLMMANDGLPDPTLDLSASGTIPPIRLKWQTAILFGIFILLNALPLPWVWLNPTGLKRSHAKAEPAQSQE